MVQSNKYKFRAVCVTYEVGLTTDRDLAELVFVIRPTKRTSVSWGRSLGGTGRRAVAQARSVVTKMSRAPPAFPLEILQMCCA